MAKDMLSSNENTIKNKKPLIDKGFLLIFGEGNLSSREVASIETAG